MDKMWSLCLQITDAFILIIMGKRNDKTLLMAEQHALFKSLWLKSQWVLLSKQLLKYFLAEQRIWSSVM